MDTATLLTIAALVAARILADWLRHAAPGLFAGPRLPADPRQPPRRPKP